MRACRGPIGTATGTAATLNVVTMGQMLSALDGVAGSDSLLEKIRRRELSAEAELTALYLLKLGQPNCRIDLEPEVDIGGRTKKPDFRIRSSDCEWTYVEVTQTELSQEEAVAQRILETLAALIKPIKRTFALEVYLRRVPTDSEVNDLKARIPEFCLRDGLSRDTLGDLGFLLLNHDTPGEAILRQHDGEKEQHGLCILAAVSGPDEPLRHITVRITFADGATTVPRVEAKQLPKEAPGLIMVQMWRAPGGFRTWEPILRRRLQPRLHTRVSAVCLFQSGLEPTPDGEAWIPHTRIVSNSHAVRPLPNWIDEQLARFALDPLVS